MKLGMVTSTWWPPTAARLAVRGALPQLICRTLRVLVPALVFLQELAVFTPL